MKLAKKTKTWIAISLIATTTSLTAPKAHAFVEFFASTVFNSIIPFIGAAVLGVGAVGLAVDDAAHDPDSDGFLDDFTYYITATIPVVVGGAGAVLGTIYLDGTGSRQLVFKPMSNQAAQSLGVTQEERDSYNGEVDEVNAVEESVASDLSALSDPTALDSANAWAKYGSSLSPATQSAVRIIARSAISSKIF